MAFIPESNYQVKYTKGKEFVFKVDRSPYVGNYLKINNGKYFAGDNPETIGKELIYVKVKNRGNINTNPLNNKIYLSTKPDFFEKRNDRLPIESHTPLPSALDYKTGNFRRYLVIETNSRRYIEIAPKVYKNFTTKKYDVAKYKKFSILWSLKPDNEVTNSNMLLFYESKLPGIFDFFPDKGQFGYRNGVVNLKNETGTRIYPNGEFIDQKLPRAYQLGNPQVNTKNNNSVPSYQSCTNCKFRNENMCSKWGKAEIRSNYWCAAWGNIGSQK